MHANMQETNTDVNTLVVHYNRYLTKQSSMTPITCGLILNREAITLWLLASFSFSLQGT